MIKKSRRTRRSRRLYAKDGRLSSIGWGNGRGTKLEDITKFEDVTKLLAGGLEIVLARELLARWWVLQSSDFEHFFSCPSLVLSKLYKLLYIEQSSTNCTPTTKLLGKQNYFHQHFAGLSSNIPSLLIDSERDVIHFYNLHMYIYWRFI
jgi:hypothetical protein